MKLWLITGYTKEIGIWEVELFTNKDEALNMFNHYVKDYNAELADDCEWNALCSDGIGRFFLEERELNTGKFEVTEKQMDLICSIINTVIDNSEGCKNGEWDVETNGMYIDEDSYGFITGDDMDDSEEEVTNGLKFVLHDCL